MHRGWTPRWHTIFAVATVLGLFSAFQAYRLTMLTYSAAKDFLPLLWLNIAYWYVPAALTPAIFKLANRFRFERSGRVRSLVVHVVGLGAFSIIHAVCMLATRLTIWRDGGKAQDLDWWTFGQRLYLTNFDWAMMTYSALVVLSLAVAYYRESQDRAVRAAQLETNLVEAQLKALQAQLQPHFLFNTLHAISALVHKDPELADRTISRLSDLLRLTLDHSGVQTLPLKEEVEFLEKYLEIERTRFPHKLQVRFDIDARTLDALVPRLILQPLVENAIKHGITPKTAQALIAITAQRTDAQLVLQVRDNGAGLSGSALAALEKGIGLSNTRARLQCLYPGEHRLEFTNRDGGLTVKIVLPFKAHDGSEAAVGSSRVA